MNKIFVYLSILPVLIISCQKNEQRTKHSEFIIKGTFSVADPTPMKLYFLGESDQELIDSIQVKNQEFELRGRLSDPGVYLLQFFNDQRIYLIIKPKDKITLTIDNKFQHITYYVEGSYESKRLKDLMDTHDHSLYKIDRLSQDHRQNLGDLSLKKKIDSAYMTILKEMRDFAREFIYSDPASLANIMALLLKMGRDQDLFDDYDDFYLFRFVDSCMVEAYPNAAPVRVLNRDVNELKLRIENRKLIGKIVEAGRPLPALEFPDIKGDTVLIPESPSIPVLIYFWASWNPFSVEELLRLEKYYASIASDRLKIVSISLDTRSEELIGFMEEHKLQIPVICDYQYWDSELTARYAVRQIPSTLLSNSEGLIVAKDIYGDELYNRLNDLITP